MVKKKNEIDTLLALNGERYFVDHKGDTKFSSRPHALRKYHKHIGNRFTHYRFNDAYTLLEDFWKEIDKRISGGALDRKGELI